MKKKIIINVICLVLMISLVIGSFYVIATATIANDEFEKRDEQLIKLDLTIHYGFEPVYWEFTKIEFEDREAYLVKVYTYEQTGGPHSVHPVEWKFFAAVEEEKDGTYDVDTEEIYTRERLYK